MNFIVWIIFGALVGWVASIVMNTNKQQGALANIAVGIVGALIGGTIAESLGGQGVTGFNLVSFLIALAGAIILIAIFKFFTRMSANRASH